MTRDGTAPSTAFLQPTRDWLKHQRDAFLKTLKQPDRVSFALAGGCAAAAFALFALIAPNGFELGDAPYYASYIAERSLGYATKHIGYYLLGIGFTSIAPLEADYALNLFAALSAAISVGLAGLIASTLTGRKSALLAASAALLVPYTFATQGVNAEVYAPQLAFFLLSAVFALWDRPIGSGLAFAAAFLITPSTALALPFVLLLRPTRRFLIRWVTAAATPVLAVLLPVLQDFLFGAHGVLAMAPANLDFAGALRKEGHEMLGFSTVMIPALVGLAQLVSSTRHRIFTAALSLLWAAPFAFGERYSDVPVQLPFYAMLAVLAGVGSARLLHAVRDRRAAGIAVALLLVGATLVPAQQTYRKLVVEAEQVETQKATILAIGRSVNDGDIAVAPYAVTVLGSYYLSDTPLEWVDDEALAGKNGSRRQADAQRALSTTLDRGRAVWLPGDFDRSAFGYFASVGYTVERFGSAWVAHPAVAQ